MTSAAHGDQGSQAAVSDPCLVTDSEEHCPTLERKGLELALLFC